MIKTKWFLRAFAIVAGISFASCDDKNKNDEPTPVFPDEVSYTVAAGETKELTFTANATWVLSTNAPTWCVFMDGEEERIQKTGQAGENTVTIKVADVNHEFDTDATAVISLTMLGDTKPVFKITRPGKERKVTMYKKSSGAWVEIEKVELGYLRGESTSVEIGFTANFDWKVLSKSDNVVLPTALSGSANGTTEADFKNSYVYLTKSDVILAEPFEGEIVISDLEGNNEISFEVTYPGMGDEDLFFDETRLRSGFGASINFSNMGYRMSWDATPVPTEDMSFTFTAVTKGMKSTGCLVSFDGTTAQIAADPWLDLTSNGNGSYTIKVKGDGTNPGDARDLHVFIFPEAMGTVTDFSDHFANGESKGIYTFKVAQAAAPVTGLSFFIGWGMMQTPIADGKIVSFDDHPFFAGESESDFGLVDGKTYVYEFTNADVDGALTIAPLGINYDDGVFGFANDEGWSETDKEGTWVYSLDGMGINIRNIKNDVTAWRMMYVKFWESQADKDVNKEPASVLVLRQIP